MNILRSKTKNLKDIGVHHKIEIRKTLRTMMLVKNLDYPKMFLISGIMALIYSEGSFISKSWTVEEEVIQRFDIETANTNRIKCLN